MQGCRHVSLALGVFLAAGILLFSMDGYSFVSIGMEMHREMPRVFWRKNSIRVSVPQKRIEILQVWSTSELEPSG